MWLCSEDEKLVESKRRKSKTFKELALNAKNTLPSAISLLIAFQLIVFAMARKVCQLCKPLRFCVDMRRKIHSPLMIRREITRRS